MEKIYIRKIINGIEVMELVEENENNNIPVAETSLEDRILELQNQIDLLMNGNG